MGPPGQNCYVSFDGGGNNSLIERTTRELPGDVFDFPSTLLQLKELDPCAKIAIRNILGSQDQRRSTIDSQLLTELVLKDLDVWFK